MNVDNYFLFVVASPGNVLKFWSLTFDDCLMFAKSQPANIRQGCKSFLGENTLCYSSEEAVTEKNIFWIDACCEC
jgi:hypothetical protein